MSSIFGSLGSSQQQQKPTLSLFGSLGQTSQPQQSSLFGSLSQPQQQQTPSLFGGATTQQQPASGLFGSLGGQQQQQQSSGLFSSSAPKPSSSLFGQQLQPGPLGQSTAQQPASSSLFGASQQQIAPLPGLKGASEWRAQSVTGREKPIQEQIESLAKKWAPEFSDSVFQTYLYNAVAEADLPFFAPGVGEDERKWEEALQKRPMPNTIPVLARGFESLGYRLKNQNLAADMLRRRLHDINGCLSARLATHDTNTTNRARQARQKHQVLSRRCLALATKVQVLRNRGYALDRTEERLRQQLTELEKQAFDPVLYGRQEEIWARLAVIREKADQIAADTKNMGEAAQAGADGDLLSEKEKDSIKKILTDYDSQLAHLKKEVEMITKDFEEWEAMTKTNGAASKK